MSLETPASAARTQSHHRLESAARTLLTRGSMSRTELAEATGYSPSAITATIRDLLELGLVRETGLAESTGGRRRTMLQFERSAVLLTLVAVDTGHLVVRQVDLDGTVQVQVRRPLDQTDPLRSVLNALGAIRAVAVAPSPCIVISLPGVVSAEGAVHLAPALGDAPPVSLRDAVARATGAHVIVENDVNLLALGEADGSRDDFVLVYVGEGIGAALVLDGKVRRGAGRSAGEIGFLPWGSAASTDGVGGLESHWSTSALVRRAAEMGIDAGEHGILDALAQSSRGEAGELLHQALEAWAYAAVVSICVIDPGQIVFAGDAVTLSSGHREELSALIRQGSPGGDVRVEFALQGDDAIVRGAIAHLETDPQLFLHGRDLEDPDSEAAPGPETPSTSASASPSDPI